MGMRLGQEKFEFSYLSYFDAVVVLGFTMIGHQIKLIGCLLIACELGSIGFSFRSPPSSLMISEALSGSTS